MRYLRRIWSFLTIWRTRLDSSEIPRQFRRTPQRVTARAAWGWACYHTPSAEVAALDREMNPEE